MPTIESVMHPFTDFNIYVSLIIFIFGSKYGLIIRKKKCQIFGREYGDIFPRPSGI